MRLKYMEVIFHCHNHFNSLTEHNEEVEEDGGMTPRYNEDLPKNTGENVDLMFEMAQKWLRYVSIYFFKRKLLQCVNMSQNIWRDLMAEIVYFEICNSYLIGELWFNNKYIQEAFSIF